MNKTEKIAYEWLEKQGKKDIVFQGHTSPDFVDSEGFGYEIKLSRNRAITFSAGQIDKLNAFKNVIILVMDAHKLEPIAQIPIADIQGADTWKNYRIRYFSTEEARFILTLPIELKARLQEQAREKGLTLTAYIRMILTEQTRLIAKG